MKKAYLFLSVFSVLFLAACSFIVTEDISLDDMDVDADTVVDEAVLEGVVDGYLSYDWERIGFSFEYPMESYGETVEVTEQKYFDELYVGNSSGEAVIVPVKLALPATADDMENYLWVNLLDRSETCEIYEVSSSDEEYVYGYKTLVFPYGDEMDEDCNILANLYYFPANPSYIFQIGSGQTPPFEFEEDNRHFFDSFGVF